MENRFGFAKRPMPAKCPDCSSKLGPIEYGLKFDEKYKRTSPRFVDGTSFWRQCPCGCVVTWGVDVSKPGVVPYHYHQVFFRRHVLPLFDDRIVLEIVDKS